MRLPVATLAFVAAGALSLAAADRPTNADTGTIRGRVTETSAATMVGTRPLVGDLGSANHDMTDRRRAVVYVDPAPRPALEELPAGRASMDQRHEEFIPHVLAVTVGTVVDFPNDDAKFHNVFSLSRVKTFDLGRYPAGHSKAVVFDKPGIVPISCDIHTHMSAYVLVFNHPYFAVADEDGRYAIANVPAGTYTLKVWSEVGRTDPRTVVVPEGQNVECDFRIERSQ
jgi:plastocyanin